MDQEELKKSIQDKEQRLKACMDQSVNAMTPENELLMKELEQEVAQLKNKLNKD